MSRFSKEWRSTTIEGVFYESWDLCTSREISESVINDLLILLSFVSGLWNKVFEEILKRNLGKCFDNI